MHFVVFFCVLDDDVGLHIFKTFFPHYKIVFYKKIACKFVPAAKPTLVDCVVHGEAQKLHVLFWYKGYCIERLSVLVHIVHLEIYSVLGAPKS